MSEAKTYCKHCQGEVRRLEGKRLSRGKYIAFIHVDKRNFCKRENLFEDEVYQYK